MASGEPRRSDRWFVGWHVLYTLVLGFWTSLFLLGPADHDLGREPGYWSLYLGAIPSLVLLLSSLIRTQTAYKVAVVYGAMIAMASIVLLFATPNAMWVMVFFPMWPFILEAAVIWHRRGALCLKG